MNNIEVNRIALYLVGKLPPYYKPYHKFAFIENLEANSDSTFNDAVFERISKYITTDEAFYAECLLRLQKYSESLFLDFLDILDIPEDARGKVMSGKVTNEIKRENSKTIGFITPFDKRKEDVKNIIDGIIKTQNWEIKEFDMGEDESNILWESMKEFLKQYPVYIVDLRKKKGTTQTNINVALELGYILAHEKQCIILTDENLPSDIHGFKYIKPGKVEGTAGESAPDMTEVNKKFKKDLEDAILPKIRSTH